MIFDRRLLHAQSPNYSQAERIVLFMGYGARWLKARDAMYVEPAMDCIRCPIARQMLGYTTQNSGLYHGNGLDVPLRLWLRNHDCNEGLGFQLAISDADHRGSGHQPTSALDGEVGHATFPRNPDRLAWPVGDFDIDKWRHARDIKLGLTDHTPVEPLMSEDATDEEIFADCRIADCAIDPELYAANRLTDVERQQFDRDGYVIVEDVLPEPLFEQCKRTLLQMAADEIAKGTSPAHGSDRGGGFPPTVTAACFSQANDLQLTPLTKLLTTPKILPKVIDIMGTNTTCYHFHCNVTPGKGGSALSEGDDSDGHAPNHPDFDSLPCFGFHQDSGLQADCEYRPAPRFSMKAGFFFTDVTNPGMANTWIVPGKHLDADLSRPNNGERGQPHGAIPVCCKANSALLFDRRLW
jgi:ectoine hydroxylase-related dioxygenase (phytanoyl-CoA dioxygenase family)